MLDEGTDGGTDATLDSELILSPPAKPYVLTLVSLETIMQWYCHSIVTDIPGKKIFIILFLPF